MDGVLLPSLLWGLESVALVKSQHRRLDAFQSTVVGRMLRVSQRSAEPHADVFRRRQRCVTGAIKRYARGQWGKIQKYRYFGFRGHVERLGEEHDVGRVACWRNSERWSDYKAGLPAKTGGQQGPRPQDRSNPCRDESPMQKALEHAQSKPWWNALEAALLGAGLQRISWQAIAQIRGAWRAFGRRAAFRTRM